MDGKKDILKEVGNVRSSGMHVVRKQEGRKEAAETGQKTWYRAVWKGRQYEQSVITHISYHDETQHFVC